MGYLANFPAAAPVWTKYTVPYTSVQAAATTNAVTLVTLPAKGTVHAACMNVTTAFSGGAIASITGSAGIVGSLAKFIVATTVAATGLTAGVSLSVPDTESMSSATAVQANFISVGANLSALTQGSVDIYLLTSVLP